MPAVGSCWYCNSELPDGAQYCPACVHSQSDRTSSPLFGVVDPVTMDPEQKISDALEVMKRYRISGVPVTKNGKLVGILTNRDVRFASDVKLDTATGSDPTHSAVRQHHAMFRLVTAFAT